MRSFDARIFRVLGFVAFGLVVPACGGHRSSSPAPAILFAEGFASFPNPDWTVDGSGVVSVDGTTGTPVPSLSTEPGSAPKASLTIQSTVPVGGTDLSFSADVLLADVGPGGGAGSFVVRDSSGVSVVAAAAIAGESGTLTLTIDGAPSPPLGLSAGWHGFDFTFDAAGNASWFVDGVLQFSASGFVPPDFMIVSLENTSGAVFNFDSVFVTSP